MYKNHLFAIVLLLCSFTGIAQLNDEFNDGDFTSNPAWTGDVSCFTVNSSLQLQLNSQGENTSALATSLIWSGEMEWSFWIRLAFSPSDNNLAKIFLLSDQENVKESLNGWFLKLGESGSGDAIELFRQNGTTVKSICRGSTGLLASSFSIRIKVRYAQDGEWKIWADPGGGEDYRLEATGNDPVLLPGSWFGLSCKYTTSNSTRFYFDDFYAGPMLIDSLPPELINTRVISTHSLQLEFTEKISSSSASLTSNYLADHGLGNPIMVQQDAEDPSLIVLVFAAEIQSDQIYHLQVSGLSDFSGNIMEIRNQPFSWHDIQSYEVLITEIMCDPDPVVHLPGFEYLEIYNNSVSVIDLEDWTLVTGATIKTLPAFTLEPDHYVLVADDAATEALKAYGDVITFTSFYLNNSGMSVTLRSPGQKVIFHADYTDRWYRDDYKKNGGWSLEMIDPQNPCGGADNWMASIDNNGGTPGKKNSVSGHNPDIQPPMITGIGLADENHLLLSFSESMDTATLLNPAAYTVDQGIGAPVSVAIPSVSGNAVILALGTPLERGPIYHLEITGILADCAGNTLVLPVSRAFAYPEIPEANDLIINEVLFNPKGDCQDFVEIFNRSLKSVDLMDITLANLDTLTGLTSSVSVLSRGSRLLFPGEYLAITTDTTSLVTCCLVTNPGSIAETSDLPPMANESGTIALLTKAGIILDRFSYNESMHYPLLTSFEGVSLERINPEVAGSTPLNWHSAAESCGYSTPGSRNSQFCLFSTDDTKFAVTPEVFSPDNDGHDDNLLISYNFDQPGNNVSVRIFDAGGQMVRQLVNNDLCGTSGNWIWDGMDDRRLKAPIGRYIILIETFTLEGKTSKYKQTVVLGGYL